MASTAIRQARSLHARASKEALAQPSPNSRSSRSEQSQTSSSSASKCNFHWSRAGEPHVAAVGADRRLCDLRLHGDESMPRPSRRSGGPPVRQSPYRDPLTTSNKGCSGVQYGRPIPSAARGSAASVDSNPPRSREVQDDQDEGERTSRSPCRRNAASARVRALHSGASAPRCAGSGPRRSRSSRM
jgi:hypothetical protein